MRALAVLVPLLCALITMCFLPSVQGRPRAPSKQERIASILAQKPMHTTALLAGAAMPTPSPYPSHASDLGYTERPPLDDEDDQDFDVDEDDNEFEVELRR